MKTIIIGAGTAGLFAAYKLINAGINVEVYESASKAGGRCSSFFHKEQNDTYDNGQHLFMGAYKNFFELINAAGAMNCFHIEKYLSLNIKSPCGKSYHLNAGNSSGKAGMLKALMNLEIPFYDKMKIINFILKIYLIKTDSLHKSAKQLLEKSCQTDLAMKIFWEPLIIATLNTSPSIADAQLLINVLKKAFFSDAASSQMLFPIASLAEIYQKITDYLKSKGVVFHFNQRVERIIFDEDKAIGIGLAGGENHFAADIISAVPYHQFLKILPKEYHLIPELKPLKFYSDSSILSAYLWFESRIESEYFFAGINSNIQWVFNRSEIQNSNSAQGRLAITISDAERFNSQSKYEIIDTIIEELQEFLPELKENKLLSYQIIKEKRATFTASAEIEPYRIEQITSLESLYIIGDWTNTKLPATIEGACVSAQIAASSIIKKLK